MMTETLGSYDKTRQYFDAIDKARALLENHKDLSKAIPSCVVVGMQSVGKSAVLSRVSGIPFPQDSEVCTRVAMELRLRRGNTGASVVIAGDTPVPIDNGIENALTKAQLDVLGGRPFEDKLSVKIDKTAPYLPEVTLVDLPGVFFAKNDQSDELEDKVKNMIAERVNNEMALICHVVPLNQDTDTISTWRIVHEADKEQKRTISVLTKADIASKDGKESMKGRLEKVVRESKLSECFIIHGAAKDCAEEESQLSVVRGYVEEFGLADQILIGVKELNMHIEKRMLSHIKERIPEMRRLLEAEMRSCTNKLQAIGRNAKSPLDIAMRDIDIITNAIHEAFSHHESERRKLTEEMNNNILGIEMEPLGLVDLEESKEHLKRQNQSNSPGTKEMCLLHALAMEVKKLEEDSRGHINVAFVGKEAVLKRWVCQFATPCSEIIEEYTDDEFKIFCQDILTPSLNKGCSEATKQVRKKIEVRLMQIVARKREEALERVRELRENLEQNLFTTNDYYLVETASAEKQRHETFFQYMSSDYRANMKPYFERVYDISAFLETRKKCVPDVVQLNTVRVLNALVKETVSVVKAAMFEESSLELIQEPATTVRSRNLNWISFALVAVLCFLLSFFTIAYPRPSWARSVGRLR